MHFEINRKVFSAALEKCLDVVAAADVSGHDSLVRLTCEGESVVISTTFAQTTLEAKALKPGSLVVEADALSRAAKASGADLVITSDSGGARFACGKLKGTLPRGGNYDGFIEPNPIHMTLAVPAVKKVFSAVSLKDAARERSLHFAPRQGLVRVEAGDDYRGAFCIVNIDKQNVNAETMTVPAKALDIVPKVFPSQCSIGLSDSVLLVYDEKTRIIVPLSARQPIDIYSQLETFLQGTEMIGSFEADVEGFATGIADVVQSTGTDKNQVTLVFESGELQAGLDCWSSASSFSTTFDLKSISMPGNTTLALSSSYLKTGLSLFSGDIRLRVYPSFVVIETLAPEAPIQLQQLALPVISVETTSVETNQTAAKTPAEDKTSEPVEPKPKKERKKRAKSP
jgi:hypothetical protein